VWVALSRGYSKKDEIGRQKTEKVQIPFLPVIDLLEPTYSSFSILHSSFSIFCYNSPSYETHLVPVAYGIY
jgi:hypothetical protein